MSEEYTCPICGRTSYNPNDAANKYCGYCHEFEEDGKTGLTGGREGCPAIVTGDCITQGTDSKQAEWP